MCARGVFQTNAQTANAKQSVELVSTHAGGEYAHACYKDTNHLHARLIKGSSAHLHRDFPPIKSAPVASPSAAS